jgi:hypothetical protein
MEKPIVDNQDEVTVTDVYVPSCRRAEYEGIYFYIFERRTKVGFLYYHWAIYIGPYNHLADNRKKIIFKHAVAHLHGKQYNPEHECLKEACSFSVERPSSLGHLIKQIKDSVTWRINNEPIEGHERRDRIETALLALAASSTNSSPAA